MKTLNKFILLAGGKKAIPSTVIKEMWVDTADSNRTLFIDHQDQYIGVVNMSIKDVILYFDDKIDQV